MNSGSATSQVKDKTPDAARPRGVPSGKVDFEIFLPNFRRQKWDLEGCSIEVHEGFPGFL